MLLSYYYLLNCTPLSPITITNNCDINNNNADDNSETFPYTSEIITKPSNSLINVNSKENFSSDDNDWSEDEAEIPAVVTDTMLTANFVENNECHVLNLAPAEGSRPVSIFHVINDVGL